MKNRAVILSQQMIATHELENHHIGAMTAPRQVAAQDVVLARPVLIGSAEPPYSAMGQLRAGVTVHVIEGLTPDRARVTFTTSSGKTYEGSARFVDLGI